MDDEDYDRLNKYKYNFKIYNGKYVCYVLINIKLPDGWYRGIRLHRWILGNIPQGMVVDHINKEQMDNRKYNLRVVTQRVNAHNRKDNKKHIGVYYHGGRNLSHPYKAMIYHNNKNYSLGWFSTEQEAINARRKAEHIIATGGVLS